MIKRILLIVIFLLVIFSGPASAGSRIFVVQSARLPPYENALDGFKSAIDKSVTRYIVSEHKNKDIEKEIEKSDPAFILAIGYDALKKVKNIKHIPVIYMMVLNPRDRFMLGDNVSGIQMVVSPKTQLQYFKKTLPEKSNIGVIYNPDFSNDFMMMAHDSAQEEGITLINIVVKDPVNVPSAVMKARKGIDALWIIPDVTVLTPEIIEFLIIYSIENSIPIFTFSKKYLETGALLSVDVDPREMGKQAAKLALDMLDKNTDSRAVDLPAEKGILSINMKIADKLGIQFNQEVIENYSVME